MSKLAKASSSLVLFLFLAASSLSCWSYADTFRTDISQTRQSHSITAGTELPSFFLQTSDTGEDTLKSLREPDLIISLGHSLKKSFIRKSTQRFIHEDKASSSIKSKYLQRIISLSTLF